MALVPQIAQEVVRAPGRALDPVTRSTMEARFSTDFSAVRVHTDAAAAESARAVGALAYTVGQQIAFAVGRYAPHTSDGRRLLAHELAHTIEQRSGVTRLQRQPAATETESEAEAPRFVGDPSRPELLVTPLWLTEQGVPLGTTEITGDRYPRAVGSIVEALVAFYPWASLERARVRLDDMLIVIPATEWELTEIRVPLHASAFKVIGLPPYTPIQALTYADRIVLMVDTVRLYEGSDPATLADVKAAIAEEAARRLEETVGQPIDGLRRPRTVDLIAGSLPNTPEVAEVTVTSEDLVQLFGEVTARAFAASHSGEAGLAGPVLQLQAGPGTVQVPGDLTSEEVAVVERLLQVMFPAAAPTDEPPWC